MEVQVAQEDKEPREGLGGRGAAQVLTEGRGLWEVSDHGRAKIHSPGGGNRDGGGGGGEDTLKNVKGDFIDEVVLIVQCWSENYNNTIIAG